MWATSFESNYESVKYLTDLVIGSSELGQLIDTYYARQFQIHKHSSFDDIHNYLRQEINEYEIIALVRNHFDVYQSFYGWIERIFKFHAQRTGISLCQLKEKVIDPQGEYHFEKWGSAIAYASSTSLNSFVEICLTENKLPRETYLKRSGYGKHGNIRFFCLNDIESLYQYIESKCGLVLPRAVFNRSNKRDNPIPGLNKSQADRIKQLYLEDFEYFDF